MKTVTLSCDGCAQKAPGDVGVMPDDWFEVSSSGWSLGIFCARCAKAVNVSKLAEQLKAQRAEEQQRLERARQLTEG